MAGGPWWDELSTFLSMQDVRIAAFLESILEGVSWPGGGRPVPNSRWTQVMVPATANVLATVTQPAPGAGLFLVITQAVFTMANTAITVSSTKAGLVTDADGGRLFGGVIGVPAVTVSTKAGLVTDSDGGRLFGGVIGVPAVIGAYASLLSTGPLSVPENKAVTAAFGSAGGAGVYEAVSLAGYVAHVP